MTVVMAPIALGRRADDPDRLGSRRADRRLGAAQGRLRAGLLNFRRTRSSPGPRDRRRWLRPDRRGGARGSAALIFHRNEMGEKRRLTVDGRRRLRRSRCDHDQRAALGFMGRRRIVRLTAARPGCRLFGRFDSHTHYLSQIGTTRPCPPTDWQGPCRSPKSVSRVAQSLRFSNCLGIGRSFGGASIPQGNARRGGAFQKGANVTRFDQPAGVPDAAEILGSIGESPMSGGSTATR